MAPRFLKLTNAGESCTLEVESVAPGTGKYPDMCITGRISGTGELVSIGMPTSSFERQIGRMKVPAQELVGETVTISRDPNQNGGSPFWGLNWGEPARSMDEPQKAAQRGSQGARTVRLSELPPGGYESAPPPDDRDAPADVPASEDRVAKIFALHQRCWEHVIGMCQETMLQDVTMDPASLSALTAQVFIAATQLR